MWFWLASPRTFTLRCNTCTQRTWVATRALRFAVAPHPAIGLNGPAGRSRGGWLHHETGSSRTQVTRHQKRWTWDETCEEQSARV